MAINRGATFQDSRKESTRVRPERKERSREMPSQSAFHTAPNTQNGLEVASECRVSWYLDDPSRSRPSQALTIVLCAPMLDAFLPVLLYMNW